MLNPNSNLPAPGDEPAISWPAFVPVTLLMLWAAHAAGFFPHEYAHSTIAWLLGWKRNPLDLNYGQLTASNVLLQSPIDENVNYAPIFAGHHGLQAGLIAGAGMVLGNLLLTYPLSRLGFARAKRHSSLLWALCFYWLCVASVGNLLDYVPVRTFALHGDMYTLEQGFSCSPWWVIVVLGIPSAIILVHFFIRFMPGALCWMFPQSAGQRYVMAVLTAFIVFGFYGAAGWSGSGPVSHTLSVICVCIMAPLAALAGSRFTYAQSKKIQQADD